MINLMVEESSKKSQLEVVKERKGRNTICLSYFMIQDSSLLVVPFSLCPSAVAHFCGYAGHHAQCATK